MAFFEQFDREWAKMLGRRRDTMRAMFDYLAKRRPIGFLIVETGCTRKPNTWAGDGCSTYLFDQFANEFDGQVLTVDIDPTACAYARTVVGPRTTVAEGDSVLFLHRLSRDLVKTDRRIDLLYLDAFELDAVNPIPSAVHHLKELCAVAAALGPHSLVVVDDTCRLIYGMRTQPNQFTPLLDMGISGKGKFVAEYFRQLGVPMLFEGYQSGWVIPE